MIFFLNLIKELDTIPLLSDIYGNYSKWTEWSECSATCGGGFRSRARNCTKPSPRHGGKNCSELGPANETQECHTHGCRKLNENLCYICYRSWKDVSIQ